MNSGLNRLTFRMFVEAVEQDDKQRQRNDDLRKLGLLVRLMQRGGLTAKLFPVQNRPYIYVWHTDQAAKGGAKVYQEGDQIAYKFQSTDGSNRADKRYDSGIKKAQDQYETARSLPLQQIYTDYMAENSLTKMQVLMRVADEVSKRFKQFFKEMKRAKKDQARERDSLGDDPRGTGVTHVGPGGGDYGHSMDRPM